MRKLRRGRVALIGVVAALAAAGSAGAAFLQLPPGDQVNNDAAAGINPALGVNGEDPTNADVVGGALDATKKNVPWAVFRAHTSGKDQIFSRSFAGGAWTTRGNGTVGGRSSAAPTFSGSLNFDQSQDGEAPAIDFAGTNRTVPWATWYENTTGTGFNANNIFASRFDNTGDANQGKWIFGGQGRDLGGGTVPVPSLNIHTGQSAENPSVAGGSTVDPTKPGPWVTWQETGAAAPGLGKDQIFTVKPTGGQANCDGFKPAGVNDGTGHVPAVGGFCWSQVGVERLSGDPSMNVDRARDGIEPDIAFTGANDAVPWVVWYETGTPSAGLHANDMVFAAKAVAPSLTTPPTGTVDGGFNWIAVGGLGQGVLDNTPTSGGPCGVDSTAEGNCSLNKDPNANAEDPRVAAGTMTAGNATVPWVTWSESTATTKKIFVSRLVTTPAPAHFELANNGSPISNDDNNSTRPDITFSGNTPYVSWREDIGGGVTKGFFGHFVLDGGGVPVFHLDASDVPLAPTGTGAGQADVREPISSGCTATPQNQDGSLCQGGALGTPFFLFTNNAGSILNLFADAYQPANPATGAAGNIGLSTAQVSGSVDPAGAPVSVSFQFGTTILYGGTTAPQKIGPDGNPFGSPIGFSANLSGLPSKTPIHYRAVVQTDFGTLFGSDQVFTTASPPPPGDGTPSIGKASVAGTTASVRASCSGQTGARCKLTFKLTVHITRLGKRIIAITARAKRHTTVQTVGSATATVLAPNSKTVKISLNGNGRKLLAKWHVLRATLSVTQNSRKKPFSTQVVKFKKKK